MADLWAVAVTHSGAVGVGETGRQVVLEKLAWAVFAIAHNLMMTFSEHILKVGLEIIKSRRGLHPARNCQPSGLGEIFVATCLAQDFGTKMLGVLRVFDAKEAAIGAGLDHVATTISPHRLRLLDMWLLCRKTRLRWRRRGRRWRLHSRSLHIVSERRDVCLPNVNQHGLDAADVLYGQPHTSRGSLSPSI